jgi:hypothetical protein
MFPFLAEPLDEAGRIGDLAAALGERLALFWRHYRREIVLVRYHKIEPTRPGLAIRLANAAFPA